MLQLHPEAQRELHAALEHYEAIGDEVANAFDDAIRAARAAIEEHPQAWGQFPGRRAGSLGVRRFVIADFPYTLAYVIQEDLIQVIAIAHNSRRPGYWMRRLAPTIASR